MRWSFAFLKLAGFVLVAIAAGCLFSPALANQDQLFMRLLTAPDNLGLNQQLLSIQLAENDYKGASATIERLVFLMPNNSDILWLQMRVLATLENFAEAELIGRKLVSSSLTPLHIKTDAKRLLADLALSQAQQHKRISGQIRTSFGLHRNPDGASHDNRAQLYDPNTDRILFSEFSKTNRTDEFLRLSQYWVINWPDEYGFDQSTRLAIFTDIQDYPHHAAHSLHTTAVALSMHSHKDRTRQDTEIAALSTQMGHHPYLDEFSLRLTASAPVSSKNDHIIDASFGIKETIYKSVRQELLSGRLYHIKTGLEQNALSARMLFEIQASHYQARARFHSYDSMSAHIQLSTGPILSSIKASTRQYKAPALFPKSQIPIFSAVSSRIDKNISADLVFGHPVLKTPRFKLTAELKISAYRNWSNIANFTHSGMTAAICLSSGF